MECEKIQNKLVDYIENTLSETATAKIKAHLNSCKNCETALQQMEELFAEIPKEEPAKPSENLRMNFEQMLIEEKQLQQTKLVQLQPKKNWKSYLQIAASIALIVSAFFFGKTQQNTVINNLAEITNEQKVSDQKELLALIEDQSASKRIQAVGNSENFEDTDTKIIQALINRMFFDENTNVRLAAAEALSKFSSLEMVKSALIKSLETEESPIIQIELIQILAKIQEKRALEPMKRLLNDKNVPNYVKQELRFNISSLL